ncbi:MAG: response regulator [Proteobacteria bacterium]|nr:MAG: response regulator [Pseudomonadota bacterium]
MKTILVVDDSEMSRKNVLEVLEGGDWKIIEAADGLQAFAICESERIDLIISDYNMPGLDGMAFASKLFQQQMNIPFIMLTTESSKRLREESKLVGVRAWAMKPLIGKIRPVVEKLLQA